MCEIEFVGIDYQCWICVTHLIAAHSIDSHIRCALFLFRSFGRGCFAKSNIQWEKNANNGKALTLTFNANFGCMQNERPDQPSERHEIRCQICGREQSNVSSFDLWLIDDWMHSYNERSMSCRLTFSDQTTNHHHRLNSQWTHAIDDAIGVFGFDFVVCDECDELDFERTTSYAKIFCQIINATIHFAFQKRIDSIQSLIGLYHKHVFVL